MRAFRLGLTLVFLTFPAVAQVNVGFGGVTHDATQAIEVTSDTLSIDQTSGAAVFSGNVIILQGDLRMAAGDVRVVYATTDGRNDVQTVIASGGVLVARGDDAAEGARAEYDVAGGLLTLSGDVLVTQGTTAISGDSMVVDMATGNGTVDGRVRTVLQSGDR